MAGGTRRLINCIAIGEENEQKQEEGSELVLTLLLLLLLLQLQAVSVLQDRRQVERSWSIESGQDVRWTTGHGPHAALSMAGQPVT